MLRVVAVAGGHDVVGVDHRDDAIALVPLVATQPDQAVHRDQATALVVAVDDTPAVVGDRADDPSGIRAPVDGQAASPLVRQADQPLALPTQGDLATGTGIDLHRTADVVETPGQPLQGEPHDQAAAVGVVLDPAVLAGHRPVASHGDGRDLAVGEPRRLGQPGDVGQVDLHVDVGAGPEPGGPQRGLDLVVRRHAAGQAPVGVLEHLGHGGEEGPVVAVELDPGAHVLEQALGLEGGRIRRPDQTATMSVGTSDPPAGSAEMAKLSVASGSDTLAAPSLPSPSTPSDSGVLSSVRHSW